MVRFRERVSLRKLTNYLIGGEARYFFEAKNESEVKAALKESKKRKIPVFVLAGATNVLVADKGFRGLVLRPDILFIKRTGTTVEVGVGVMMRDLLNFLAERGLAGLEWAGGLPGTVGGAVRGNAGAFGGEIKNVVKTVLSVNVKTLETITRTNPECRFKYRSSLFRENAGREIILETAFSLRPGDPREIKSAILEKIRYRAERQPIDYPNVGSIFKNVPVKLVPQKHLPALSRVIKTDPMPVVPAAHLISEVGLRGVSFGGAMISPKHSNFIVNVCDASSSDVKTLIKLVKDEVYRKFHVRLEEEIEFLE